MPNWLELRKKNASGPGVAPVAQPNVASRPATQAVLLCRAPQSMTGRPAVLAVQAAHIQADNIS